MNRTRSLVTALVLFAGCNSGTSHGANAGSGATNPGAGGGGGTAASGSGGFSGGGGSLGGAGTTAGTGGAVGSSSGGAGSSSSGGGAGGVVGAGGSGAGGGGGASGAGGTGAGGTGTGGAGASPAAALDKFRFDCPCKPGAADHTSNDNCNVTPETDRQTVMKTMGGVSGTVYNVKLRVRGLTEPNTYTGGMLDANNRFYTGGTTSTPGYTSYMMTVADPAQHYFFNYNATTSHMHFLLDYMVTVKIRGGTTVTFDVDGDGSQVDGHQVANFDMLVVPDVPPAPNWYDGQFVQLDVVSAEPAL